ncbi:MAG: Nif3-like dinuclear metal center hexameric protein [Pirellulales bacterium]
MPTVADLADFLESYAPSALAEEWDNVGLLVGDRGRPVERAMTCLTITPDSAAEAIAERANVIVTHHPLPFRPLKRLTADTTPGRLLLDLIAAGISIYSPHTAFDSALGGINRRLAEGLGLSGILPLDTTLDELGAGRFGQLPKTITLRELAQQTKAFLKIGQLQSVGQLDQPIARVAVACGSAGQFLEQARRLGCQALLTGETNFHTCLEAESTGVGLLLCGHYASERFGVEALADVLAQQFTGMTVWASRREHDPLQWV